MYRGLIVGAAAMLTLSAAQSAAAQSGINTDMSAFRQEQLQIATRTDKMMVAKMSDGQMMVLVPMAQYDKMMRKRRR